MRLSVFWLSVSLSLSVSVQQSACGCDYCVDTLSAHACYTLRVKIQVGRLLSAIFDPHPSCIRMAAASPPTPGTSTSLEDFTRCTRWIQIDVHAFRLSIRTYNPKLCSSLVWLVLVQMVDVSEFVHELSVSCNSLSLVTDTTTR